MLKVSIVVSLLAKVLFITIRGKKLIFHFFLFLWRQKVGSGGFWLFGSFPTYTISVALLAGIFHCMPLRKNNNAAFFFVSLKLNNSEGFIGAPYFFSFRKRPNISLYVGYSQNLK